MGPNTMLSFRKLMSQSQENFQTKGWKDGKTEGWTLIHRTLPATAGGPTKNKYTNLRKAAKDIFVKIC